MTRLWLLRLAPVLLAAFQLAIPRLATAAELAPTPRPTGIAPRVELCAKAVLARTEPRAAVARHFDTTACTAATPVTFPLQVLGEPITPASQRPVGSAIVLRQPPARAPPALS